MFFGAILSAGKSYKFDKEDITKGDVLNISNAVLATPGKKVNSKSI